MGDANLSNGQEYNSGVGIKNSLTLRQAQGEDSYLKIPFSIAASRIPALASCSRATPLSARA